MEMRPGAPSLTRPGSPAKQSTTTLADFPEAIPGPNAFAQQAQALERHHLSSNAFYQEAHRIRMAPTDLHPAFRPGFSLDAEDTNPATAHELRESTVTTMSPFIDAAKGISAPLHVLPANSQFSHPTTRGLTEERHERKQHATSGDEDERTPVYSWQPEPKATSPEPPKPANTPKKSRISLPKKEGPTGDSGKSPKKSLLDLLRMTKIHNTPPPAPAASTGKLSSIQATSESSQMPIKAQAVLGAAPSDMVIPRTPSKRRGLFARKHTGGPDAHASKIPGPYTSPNTNSNDSSRDALTKTPQGAAKLTPAGRTGIQRSQSLKYFDNLVPPTPPAKNTPPDVRAAKQQADAMNMNKGKGLLNKIESNSQPLAKEPNTKPLNRPTMFGMSVHQETPTLVTKPSVYSLHASVVPALTSASSFEDMKSRIDNLDLEGFNMPSENVYQPSPEFVYSPSVYDDELKRHSQLTVGTPRHGNQFTAGALPTVHESPTRGAETQGRSAPSSSSGSTIAVFYPELARDTSLPTVAPLRINPRSTSLKTDGHPSQNLHKHSPEHSASPSADALAGLLNTPVGTSPRDKQQGTPTSFSHKSAVPSPLHFLPATVYAPKAPRVRPQQHPEHHSNEAMATQQESTVHRVLCLDPVKNSVFDSPSDGKGTRGYVSSLQASSVPPFHPIEPRASPSLRAPAQMLFQPSSHSSPRPSFQSLSETLSTRASPVKPETAAASSDAEKHKQLLDMLTKFITRNGDVDAIREEIRANHQRLDERLAAMENAQPQAVSLPTIQTNSPSTPQQLAPLRTRRMESSQPQASSPPAATASSGTPRPRRKVSSRPQASTPPAANPSSNAPQPAVSGSRRPRRSDVQRIPTVAAHEFYRRPGEGSAQGLSATASGGPQTTPAATPAATIADFVEANMKLVEMMRGFAEKLEGLEKKVAKGSGEGGRDGGA